MGISFNAAQLLNGNGIDVNSLVSQIQTQESGELTVWQQEQTTLQTQATDLNSINTDLNNLATAVQALSDPTGALASMTATSSMPAILTATAQNSAAPGSHTIEVTTLASAGTVYTNAVAGGATVSFLPSGATGGDLQLQIGTTTEDIPITPGSNDTLNTLVSYINQQSTQNNWGVTATVLNDASGARLAIYSQATGTPGALAITTNTSTGMLNTADLSDPNNDSILQSGQSTGDIKLQIGPLTQVGTTNTTSGAAVLSGGTTGSTWASTVGGLTSATDISNGGANNGDIITVNLTTPGTGAQTSYSYTIGQTYGGVQLTTVANLETILAATGQMTASVAGGVLTVTANASQVSLTDTSNVLASNAAAGTSSAAATASTFTIGTTNSYTYSTYGVGSSATVGNLIQAINADGRYSASLNASGDLVIGYGSVAAAGTGVAPALAETGAGTWAVGAPASFSPSGATVDIPITQGSNDTLTTLASYINTQSTENDWGVTANVVQDSGGYHLSITSQAQGPAGDLAFTTNTNTILTTVANPATNLTFATPVGGTNAQLSIDNIPFSSTTNTVTNAIPGVTLNLVSAEPGVPLQLSIGPDTTDATNAINTFVTAYNTVIGDINQQFTVNTTTNTEGPLGSDSSLRQLQSSLLSDINYSASGNSTLNNLGYVNLASLGINMNDDGTLTVDSTTLNNALTTNPSAVLTFFQNSATGSLPGFATAFNTDLTNLTDPTNGILNLDLAENNTDQTDVSTDISNFQDQLATQKQQLINEYSQVNAQLEEYPYL
ncbi:MAG TPA: flagellar filament capping protein FliD, partial [Terriglobales bacterium]|nr:flagellar filament capping protein FliD [Terriglobales bacterium]